MESIFQILRSNDTLYWLYAKSLYTTQRYFNDVFEANKIIENLWLGGITSTCNREALQNKNINLIITAVLGSCATFPYNFQYDRAKLKDNDSDVILPEIQRLVPIIHQELKQNKGVLVSCIKGRSRSCTIVAAYLIKYHKMTTQEALNFIKDKRSQIQPIPSYITTLKLYELSLKQIDDSEIKES
jgi:hypothetical protein